MFENAINNMAISTTDCTVQEENCFKSFGTFNKICKNVSSNTDSISYFYEHCGVNGQGKICTKLYTYSACNFCCNKAQFMY